MYTMTWASSHDNALKAVACTVAVMYVCVESLGMLVFLLQNVTYGNYGRYNQVVVNIIGGKRVRDWA